MAIGGREDWGHAFGKMDVPQPRPSTQPLILCLSQPLPPGSGEPDLAGDS